MILTLLLLFAADPALDRLKAEITRLAQVSGGRVGASAIHLESGRSVALNGAEMFPMASTFKVPIAVQLFDLIDAGKVTLDQMVEIKPEDLHPGSGILTDLFNKPGVVLSVRNLLELMLLISDNSATDILLRLAGGPEAVSARMRAMGLAGIRVDRPTLGMIRALAKPDFDASPEDSATPDDMARLLTIVYRRGGLLLDIMRRCRTGDTRIKGLLPAGTVVEHKTGTISRSANDAGIITLPGDAGHVALAVFVKSSTRPAADRDRAIAEIARAVHDFFVFNPEGPLNYTKMANRILEALRPEPGEKAWYGGDRALFPELRALLLARLPQAATLEEATIYLQLPGDKPPAGLREWTDQGGARRQLHFHWADGSVLTDGVTRRHKPELDAVYYEALFVDLKPALQSAAQALHNARVRVTTPAGTDLTFQTGDRPINLQDGDASPQRAKAARVRIDRDIELPGGVVRVAPVEATVNGTVVLPDGKRLRIKKGKVLNPVPGLPSEFREFGLGFNPKLVPTSEVMPYYGYGAGVVRLSLGDNEELGGAVRGGAARWFFFPDATVAANGRPLSIK